MVERVARDVRWMFSPTIDVRDLAQAGAIGLCKAAASFEPARAGAAGFDSYAWFRVRGAIIDSQKRRAYREEQNDSLERRVSRDDGLTTWLDVLPDTKPLPDVDAERNQIHAMLWAAIDALPEIERRVLRAQLDGQSLAMTAREVGRSVTWTRAKLAEARELVSAAVRQCA